MTSSRTRTVRKKAFKRRKRLSMSKIITGRQEFMKLKQEWRHLKKVMQDKLKEFRKKRRDAIFLPF